MSHPDETARAPRCLVIVPAYNEAPRIAAVVADLRALGDPNMDIVVVDDGSTDDTPRVARRAGARVVSLPFNVGIGGAVQTGFQVAAAEGYAVAVQVDGDGQHPADQVPLLVEHLSKTSANYVIGSRFAAPGDYRASRARRGGISFLARLVSLLVRFPVTDATSGFRAADARAVALFAAQYPADYPEAEAIVLAHRWGLVIREVPIVMRARASGRSSITPVRSLYYMVKVSLAVVIQHLGRTLDAERHP